MRRERESERENESEKHCNVVQESIIVDGFPQRPLVGANIILYNYTTINHCTNGVT